MLVDSIYTMLDNMMEGTINISMKLKDLKEFTAIGNDRPTPVTFRRMAPPLPDELYAKREKPIRIPKKKKERKMKLKEFTELLPSVKTYTPEQIAHKHNVPLKAIEAQLKQGIKIEQEHTKDKRKAREIALDHLNELPDYYTRLRKMEGED